MADVQGNLKLFYNDKDITEDVDILECFMRDASGKESDCLNLKVDHANKWFNWDVQKNDRLRVTRSGYNSGTMYLNTIVPEEGTFRIYATSARCTPFPAKWASYEKKTLAAIMSTCAGEGGMSARQSGISGGIFYEYLLRENMSTPLFLEQLVNREGAVLKCLNGNFTAIGIEYAQRLKPTHEIDLAAKLFEVKYIDRRDRSWKSVTISTPFGSGTASDAKSSGQSRIITDITVDNNAQARRWAKGILLSHNRQSEQLDVEMEFNPGYTAMVRINVKSETDAKGAWIIDRVDHNLLDGRTKAQMLRCVTSIG